MWAATLLVACATGEGPRTDLAAALSDADGALLTEALTADTTAVGPLDPAVPVRGFVLEAGPGAVLDVTLETEGAGGEPVDATLQAWGPYAGRASPGELLGERHGAGPAALSTEVGDEGPVLVAFAAETTGSFRLTVACGGSDAQCGRVARPGGCRPATLVVQGGTVEGDQTWDACEVRLTESVTIAPGATLSIAPGVAVRSALAGAAPFGTVQLVAEGTLLAEGTAEAPIEFTALEPARGWAGLVLDGRDSDLSFVVIDAARVGVDIRDGAAATIADAVITGGVVEGARGIAGVRAGSDVDVRFERALVRGFERGLALENARSLYVEDSVIRENLVGVRVDGTDPVTSCDPEEIGDRIADYADPVLLHTDVVANEGIGILANGSDVLLQVDRCNIAGNETGIEIRGVGLGEGSHLRASNVHSNGGSAWQGRQLLSYHFAGELDATGNYWGELTAADVSQAWDLLCAAAGGELLADGFTTVPIADAVPRAQNVMASVWQESWQSTDGER
jgi:hypothetical protein